MTYPPHFAQKEKDMTADIKDVLTFDWCELITVTVSGHGG